MPPDSPSSRSSCGTWLIIPLDALSISSRENPASLFLVHTEKIGKDGNMGACSYQSCIYHAKRFVVERCPPHIHVKSMYDQHLVTNIVHPRVSKP